MPRHRLLAAAACTILTVGSSSASSEEVRTLPLDRAFRSCIGLQRNALADDLIRSIWDAGVRQRFPMTYVLQARNYQLVTSNGEGTASVELVNPSAVAGVTPRSLSASTCPDGCGLAVYRLDFGLLSAQSKSRLTSWVKAAPATEWTDPAYLVKVELRTRPDGSVSLVCDMST